MVSIISTLFHPLPNAIMTLLLGLVAFYWVFTFLVGDFLGELDLGLDTDLDTELDVGESALEPSIFQKFLSFVHVGKVPIMMVISVFKFIAWIMTIATNLLFDLSSWGWKSVLILVPIFILSFFLTRLATKPFVSIYREMGYHGEQAHDLIGRTAILKSTLQDQSLGNAELTIHHDVIKVLVKSKDGDKIPFNSSVILLQESDDRAFYWVARDINLDNVLHNQL